MRVLGRGGNGWAVTGVFLLMLSTGCAYAEGLVASFNKAKESAPALLISHHTHLAAEQIARQNRAAYLPQVNLSIQQGHRFQRVTRSGNTIIPLSSTNFHSDDTSIELTQPLYDEVKLAEIRRGEKQLAQSKQELEESRRTLMVAVAQAYFGLLASKDGLQFAEAEANSTASAFKEATRRLEAGLMDRVTYQDVAARKAKADSQLLLAEQARIQAEQGMQQLTGEKPGQVNALSENFPHGQFALEALEKYLERGKSRNSRLLALQESLAAARARVDGRLAGNLPKIDFKLSQSWNNASGSLYGGGNDVSTSLAAVTLNMPLYSSGATDAATKQAVEEATVAEQRLIEAQRQVVSEVQVAWFGVRSAVGRMLSTTQAVTAYATALTAKKVGESSGLFNPVSVLEAERDYYQAKRDAASSRYEFVINMLNLLKASGDLSEDQLKRVDGWLGS